MAKYFVVIEDAGSVEFDDYVAAYAHALKVAKTLAGVGGGPRIRVKGIEGYDPSWTADELLRAGKIITSFKTRR